MDVQLTAFGMWPRRIYQTKQSQDVSEEPAACVFRVQDSNAEREGSMLLQNNRVYVPNDTASSVNIHILTNNNNKFNIANSVICTMNSNYRIAATLYSIQTWFASGI
jgi:hypothetical protein